jgi:RNA recognition motif-containing protein
MNSNTGDRSNRARREEHKLWVGGLDYEVTSDDLRGLFGEFGKVRQAYVCADHVTGASRGFGFVLMSTAEEKEAARVGLDNFVFAGNRRLMVRDAHPRQPREEMP